MVLARLFADEAKRRLGNMVDNAYSLTTSDATAAAAKVASKIDDLARVLLTRNGP